MNLNKIIAFKMRINKALPGVESGSVLLVRVDDEKFTVKTKSMRLNHKEIQRMIKRRNAKIERVVCYG
jgi:hypothetical protein